MTINVGGALVSIFRAWPGFKNLINGTEKLLALQFEQDSSKYIIFALDGLIFYQTEIFKDGFEPSSWTAQQITDNTTYRTEFLSDFSLEANRQTAVVTSESTSITKRVELGETIDYIGIAPVGTLDTDAKWTIKRITKNIDGDPEKIEWTDENSTAWTDRVSATYS